MKTVNKKKPTTTADKAHAKELKRIRDAKYRAQKKAAKAKAKSKPCNENDTISCDPWVRVAMMTIGTQTAALLRISADDKVSKAARDCALETYKLGIKSLAFLTNTEEVR